MPTVACRALLFDCDGVLVDSDVSVETAWARWAADRGLDPAEVYAMAHGRRSADTVALLVEGADREAALAEIDRYEVEDAASVRALAGSRELLTSLARDGWAVITSGSREIAVARLRAAGLPLPAVLVCAEDVAEGKPDPAGFLAAAEALGVPAEQCVVFEDSAAGIEAGTAAGAAVVAVGKRALDGAARLVVRDLRGLRWDGHVLSVAPSALLRG